MNSQGYPVLDAGIIPWVSLKIVAILGSPMMLVRILAVWLSSSRQSDPPGTCLNAGRVVFPGKGMGW